jgi:integrase
VASRRGNGEGSIYKRKDGRWAGTITLGKDGSRRTYYGKTRAEVAAKLKPAAGDHERGLLPTGRRQTLGAYLTSWLEDSVQGRVRPKTAEFYAMAVRHLVAGLGKVDLDKLTPGDVERFLRSKDGQLAPRSVHHLRAVLRAALNRALRQGLVYRNVAALAAAPKVEGEVARFLNPEEAAAVLRAMKGDRLEALYTVALSLGLRQGEALGLQWDDVDLERRQLHVRQQLQRIGGRSVLVPVKTRQSRRTLPLPLVVISALQEHRRRQLDERLVQPMVFCAADGRPLNGTSVTHGFQRRLQAAGLPHLRFHDLRHSCASLLAAQGVPMRLVMEVLGHTTIATTANVYAHVFPESMEEAATAMDRALGGS